MKMSKQIEKFVRNAAFLEKHAKGLDALDALATRLNSDEDSGEITDKELDLLYAACSALDELEDVFENVHSAVKQVQLAAKLYAKTYN